MTPTEAADRHDACAECGEKPQGSDHNGWRVWHARTCHVGGYVDPVLRDPDRPESGYVHPAWGLARANVVSSTGTPLFDSDIIHSRFVTLTVATASRHRDHNRDWLHPVADFVEIHMSQAQWGALVSSFGDGAGVPVTIHHDHGRVSDVPYEPRLAESLSEVRAAATTGVEPIADGYAEVLRLFEEGAGKKAMREALRTLGHQINNAPKNMTYAAESLTEHAENVVTKARADIEATVLDAAHRAGLPASEIAQLGGGWTDPVAALEATSRDADPDGADA